MNQTTPWTDCKVAFAIEDPERLWNIWKGKRLPGLKLPDGWELNETVISGAAGYVAIFRVNGVPSIADGEWVFKYLKKRRIA